MHINVAPTLWARFIKCSVEVVQCDTSVEELVVMKNLGAQPRDRQQDSSAVCRDPIREMPHLRYTYIHISLV